MRLEYSGKKSVADILSSPGSFLLRPVDGQGNIPLDGWRNMLILSDNLAALHLLLKDPSVRGNVRLVYIDPPFSTNQVFRAGRSRTATVSRSESDLVAYRDTRTGADYLEFLRERLVLLHEILAADGTIYVHIDCKVGHYVKVIMDEIFGPENFLNDIARIKCNPKNFARRAYGNVRDMVLVYSRTSEYVWNDPREEFTEQDIRRLFPRVDSQGRQYTTTPLHAPGETRSGPTGQPWRGILPPPGRHWRYPPEELERLDRMGLIEWSSTGNPRKKIYAEEIIAQGKKRQDVWEFKDPTYPSYPTEKNLDMLRMILQASSHPGDLVLDCFVGSGTTLVAAETTGRRWIGIDNSEVAIAVCQKRMQALGEYSAYTLYRLEEQGEYMGGEEHRNGQQAGLPGSSF